VQDSQGLGAGRQPPQHPHLDLNTFKLRRQHPGDFKHLQTSFKHCRQHPGTSNTFKPRRQHPGDYKPFKPSNLQPRHGRTGNATPPAATSSTTASSNPSTTANTFNDSNNHRTQKEHARDELAASHSREIGQIRPAIAET
jgi:hypothetical protein